MTDRRKTKTAGTIRPRFRVYTGDEIALGPGKIQLLALIRETGSIRESARRMDMSYMRAWQLVRTMNLSFKHPLVDSSRGGAERGGATLTATGEAVLRLYARLETESLTATGQTRRALNSLLKQTE